MEHAARGDAALAASPADAQKAVVHFTKALLEHPHSSAYFCKRSKAFTRLSPAPYKLALQDAEYAVLLGQKRGKRAEIQSGQQRRVVALYQLGKYQDAGFLLQTMLKWRKKGQDAALPLDRSGSENNNPDQAEGHIWKIKIEGKLAKMGEEERNAVTAKEYPQVILPSEKEMIVVLQNQINSDGTYNYDWQETSKDATLLPESTDKSSSTSGPSAESASSLSSKILPSGPPAKIRHEWYQNAQSVILTIYAKGVPKDKADIDLQDDSLSISFPHPSDPSTSFNFSVDPLFALIDSSASKAMVMSTKVEFTLKKHLQGRKWADLEGKEPLKPLSTNESKSAPTDTAKAAIMSTLNPQAASTAPSYPTSSRTGPKNWDKLASDLTAKPKSKSKKLSTSKPDSDEEPEVDDYDSDTGGDAVDGFFKKLYKGADDDTRRAMMKSFQESNGTALSTDWSSVGKGKVEEVKGKDD